MPAKTAMKMKTGLQQQVKALAITPKNCSSADGPFWMASSATY